MNEINIKNENTSLELTNLLEQAQTIPLPRMSRTDLISLFEKNQQVLDFVKQHENLAEQRSDEWNNNLLQTIGGSEWYKVRKGTEGGKAGRDAQMELVKTKVGWNPFNGNVATNWGKIMEDMIRRYIEITHRTTVFELGALPGKIPYQRFSPDGLMFYPRRNAVVLNEYKCPYSRIPTGGIPCYYKTQVQAGLDTIDITDYGLYVDAVFRRCPAEHLQYDKVFVYHTPKDVKFKDNDPLACGFIGFYDRDKPFDPEHDNEIHDLGHEENIDDILVKGGDDIYGVYRSELHVFNEKKPYTPLTEFQKFIDMCRKNNHHIVGIMPYKLMAVYMVEVEKIVGYVEESREFLTETMEYVKRIRESDNPEKTFHEIFDQRHDDPYGRETDDALADFLTSTLDHRGNDIDVEDTSAEGYIHTDDTDPDHDSHYQQKKNYEKYKKSKTDKHPNGSSSASDDDDDLASWFGGR